MARMAAARSSFDILLIVAFAFALATAADALVSATASTTAAFAGGAVAFGDGDFEELANEATAFEGGVEAIAFAVGGEPTFVAALCFLAGEGLAAAASATRSVTGEAVFAGGGIAFAFACALTSACAMVLTMRASSIDSRGSATCLAVSVNVEPANLVFAAGVCGDSGSSSTNISVS